MEVALTRWPYATCLVAGLEKAFHSELQLIVVYIAYPGHHWDIPDTHLPLLRGAHWTCETRAPYLAALFIEPENSTDAGIETLPGAVVAVLAAPLGPPGEKPTSRTISRTISRPAPAEALLRCALRRGSVRTRAWWDPSGLLPGSCRDIAPAWSGNPGSGGRGCLASARGQGTWTSIVGPGRLERTPNRGGDDPWSRGLPLDRKLGDDPAMRCWRWGCPAELDRLRERAVAAPPVKESC
ncbi:hypothetical protein NDU88_006829 [Pleurodeles waltl]|uniref:Uncharacterized protein n=1 Tax=Pleurodeles waltl TaxID=8319 RepID=A0AAV7LTM6_PLEWA|nr:hypothetical protein NDU88_006829 [Pleurodeles waltl]